MNYLCLVIKLADGYDIDTVLKALSWYGRHCTVLEKEDDNPHVHSQIHTDKHINTVRNGLRIKLGSSLRSQKRSLQVTQMKDGFKNLVYIIKENKPIHNDIWTADDIERAHIETTRVNDEKAERAKPKKQGPYYKQLMASYVPISNEELTDYYRKQICDHVMDYLADTYEQVCDGLILKRVYWAFIKEFYPSVFKETLIKSTKQQLYEDMRITFW